MQKCSNADTSLVGKGGPLARSVWHSHVMSTAKGAGCTETLSRTVNSCEHGRSSRYSADFNSLEVDVFDSTLLSPSRLLRYPSKSLRQLPYRILRVGEVSRERRQPRPPEAQTEGSGLSS